MGAGYDTLCVLISIRDSAKEVHAVLKSPRLVVWGWRGVLIERLKGDRVLFATAIFILRGGLYIRRSARCAALTGV